MSKLHSYYITNASSVLKYAFTKTSDNQLDEEIEEIIQILQFGNEENFNEFDENIEIERLDKHNDNNQINENDDNNQIDENLNEN